MKNKIVHLNQSRCVRACIGNFTKATSFLLIAALMSFSQFAMASTDDDLKIFVNAFVPDFKVLDIPEFDYSYEKNFQAVQDLAGINRQLNTFSSVHGLAGLN